jgi:CheY-like chemotaxis protein
MAQEGAEENPQILVCDDEEAVRLGLGAILETEGYSVVMATDGQDALEKLRTTGINIVFSDILMPNMNGLEFLVAAKKINKLIEVIMMTGFEDEEFRLQAMEYGAAAYLRKPFKPVDVMAALITAENNISDKKEVLRIGRYPSRKETL